MVDLDVVLDVGVGLSMLDAVRTGPYTSAVGVPVLLRRLPGTPCAVPDDPAAMRSADPATVSVGQPDGRGLTAGGCHGRDRFDEF